MKNSGMQGIRLREDSKKEEDIPLTQKFEITISYRTWFGFRSKRVEEFYSPEINKAYNRREAKMETEAGLSKKLSDHLDQEGSLAIKFFGKKGTYSIPYFNVGNIHVIEKSENTSESFQKSHYVQEKLY